jgi:hypothetical protein
MESEISEAYSGFFFHFKAFSAHLVLESWLGNGQHLVGIKSRQDRYGVGRARRGTLLAS